MKIHCLPALQTNYFFILEQEGQALILDPGDAKPIFDFLENNGLKPTAIWCTHHHWDHTDGLQSLVEHFRLPVFASDYDLPRLPVSAHGLREGDEIKFQDHCFQVIEFKGHTLGHIGFHCEKEKWLFCGDTLFSLGCGRLFEGSPEQMHDSLQKIKKLPRETQVYCSHEYTMVNLEFLKTYEHLCPPEENLQNLKAFLEKRLQQEGKTIPTSVDFELRNNPFLRSDLSLFTYLRQQRNHF